MGILRFKFKRAGTLGKKFSRKWYKSVELKSSIVLYYLRFNIFITFSLENILLFLKLSYGSKFFIHCKVEKKIIVFVFGKSLKLKIWW